MKSLYRIWHYFFPVQSLVPRLYLLGIIVIAIIKSKMRGKKPVTPFLLLPKGIIDVRNDSESCIELKYNPKFRLCSFLKNLIKNLWRFSFLFFHFLCALHLIGFLNANTDRNARSPANYGLMDIIAALHWLQENIGYVCTLYFI